MAVHNWPGLSLANSFQPQSMAGYAGCRGTGNINDDCTLQLGILTKF